MENNKKELGIKSAISFLGIVIGSVVNLAMVIVIGRIIGADIYGEYTYVLSFITMVSVAAKLGFDSGLISFLSRNTITAEKKRSFLSFTLFTTAFISLMIITVGEINSTGFAKLIFDSESYGSILSALIPIIVLININAIFSGTFRGYRKIKENIGITQAVAPCVQLVSIVVCTIVFEWCPVTCLIISEYAKHITLLTYYLIKSIKYNYIGKLKKGVGTKQLFLYSIPLLLNGLVAIVINNLDKYMIGWYLEDSLVAIYKVGLQIGTLSSISLTAVNTIFSSIAASLFFDNKIGELERLYKDSTKWILTINMCIFGVIVLFSREIMAVIGAEFIIGWSVLILISIGQTVNAMFGPVGVLNSMTGKPSAQFYAGLSACITNIILNALLIPVWGINGAALASMIALIIRNIVNYTFLQRHIGISPYTNNYLKIFGVFAASAAVTYLIINIIPIDGLVRLIIGTAIFGVIYLVGALKFAINKNERQTIISFVKKGRG